MFGAPVYVIRKTTHYGRTMWTVDHNGALVGRKPLRRTAMELARLLAARKGGGDVVVLKSTVKEDRR